MMDDMDGIGVHHHHGEKIPFTVPLVVTLTRHPQSSADPSPFQRILYQTVVMKSIYAYLSSLLGTCCLVSRLIIPRHGIAFLRLPLLDVS